MATTKKDKAEPAADEPQAEPKTPYAGEVNPMAGQSIDDRMAALLKEHQEMGARPKDGE